MNLKSKVASFTYGFDKTLVWGECGEMEGHVEKANPCFVQLLFVILFFLFLDRLLF